MRRPSPLAVADPAVLHGEPVFWGTRVPVRTLFDHLAAGDPLSVFLRDFPGVGRRRALLAIERGRRGLMADARAARSLRPRPPRRRARTARGPDGAGRGVGDRR
ncbi:MAG: DUF433 domain-containing protein [Planctomycetes bacterium]|nr:DUF433 domain-containing protein [Planctomycetota bacterium]